MIWPFTNTKRLTVERAMLLRRVDETRDETRRANKKALDCLSRSAGGALDKLMPEPKREKPNGPDHR